MSGDHLRRLDPLGDEVRCDTTVRLRPSSIERGECRRFRQPLIFNPSRSRRDRSTEVDIRTKRPPKICLSNLRPITWKTRPGRKRTSQIAVDVARGQADTGHDGPDNIGYAWRSSPSGILGTKGAVRAHSRLEIERFGCVRECDLVPRQGQRLSRSDNVGKAAILE